MPIVLLLVCFNGGWYTYILNSEQAIHFTDDPGDLADDEENPARLVDESDDEGSAPKLLTVKQEEDRDTDNEKGCPSNQEDRDDSHCELHTLVCMSHIHARTCTRTHTYTYTHTHSHLL